ncbi:MAG: MGMT family protein [Limnochordales bacterium]|nr:MGMT family protein [Limnochordales bacterium]
MTRMLSDWLAGKEFTGVLDLTGLTAFSRSVLLKVREIPRGEVRSYAWVAREIGRPGAARAVGNVLARNPVPLLIPCHRVIPQSGILGEYSGGGPTMKARLLALEGVVLPASSTRIRAGDARPE